MSAEGRRLLAHELTHVVQQAGSGEASTLVVGAVDDAHERETDRVAEAVAQSPLPARSPGASMTEGSLRAPFNAVFGMRGRVTRSSRGRGESGRTLPALSRSGVA